MFLFQCETTFEGDPEAVWKIWTDVASWPEWDLTKEVAQLDGEFAAGTSGWTKRRGSLGGSFTITAVQPGRRWITECAMPLGKVTFDHLVEPVAARRVRVVQIAEAEDASGSVIRLVLVPKMRSDIAESLVALEHRMTGWHLPPRPILAAAAPIGSG